MICADFLRDTGNSSRWLAKTCLITRAVLRLYAVDRGTALKLRIQTLLWIIALAASFLAGLSWRDFYGSYVANNRLLTVPVGCCIPLGASDGWQKFAISNRRVAAGTLSHGMVQIYGVREGKTRVSLWYEGGPREDYWLTVTQPRQLFAPEEE